MNTRNYVSGSQLKWLAIVAMLLDHSAKIIYFQTPATSAVPYVTEPNEILLFIQSIFPLFITIGRLAFPIFCFLLVEGFLHTSNTIKYGFRLAIFALISEIPYDLAFSQKLFDFEQQNVFFTLFIGLLVIMGLEKLTIFSVKNLLLAIMMISFGILFAESLHTDYGGWVGVLLIVALYLLRHFPISKCLVGALIVLQNSFFGPVAFVPIYFYNGKRGRQWKYFFYCFYPLHLLILVAIQNYLVVPYLNLA
ncbi:TraX family protein [Candidatus Enterococcus mansonii]|uniref:Conjugal transfer protein TraX n=1 Tax=Candidatus Enterococcus mansonii TaxID=1834181 RepID=A0A242CIE3_9ENTE|nr:TraX family protein [Enterococcus sp. 4G2_DIV0659]OTO10007.1 hypothetical protein A5880_000690 [Enterococcus sp. 4G2_DIV0659]